MPSSPRLLPKKKPIDRRVFLEAELWERLARISDFHSEVFEALGAGEKVSRNDIIAAFLDWAVTAYWEDKGGEPTTKSDWNEKVKKTAESLREK